MDRPSRSPSRSLPTRPVRRSTAEAWWCPVRSRSTPGPTVGSPAATSTSSATAPRSDPRRSRSIEALIFRLGRVNPPLGLATFVHTEALAVAGGAGGGDRNHVTSLEGWRTAIVLRPRGPTTRLGQAQGAIQPGADRRHELWRKAR